MTSLASIAAQYDAFIIDLWGVIHDGTALYPGAAEALASLSKPAVFLSNAPRQSHKAQETLDKLGVDRAHYKTIITSGQIAHDVLKAEKKFSKYYYLGPGKDEDILSDLEAYESVDVEDAQFVLNTGYEYDFQPHEEVLSTLQKLLNHDLSLLCVNPDYEVVKQDGTHMLCAGALAQEFERMGGSVTYIGKPHAIAYEIAKKQLVGAQKILMIGDNPDTDIKGAKGAGIDSLLITGGVLKVKHGALSEAAARKLCPDATHILPAFAL